MKMLQMKEFRMNRVPTVKPWRTDSRRLQYDAFVAAVGYERRARFVAEELGIQAFAKIACAFPDRKVHHYTENYNWFTESGYVVEETTDDCFSEWFENLLRRIDGNSSSKHRICIDISSLNRTRLAIMVDRVRKLSCETTVMVDFLYSLAEFSPPPSQLSPNRHCGPVLRSFAGWTVEPEHPPVAILGLGYERDKALGAAEHIQAAKVWAFVPESPILRYTDAVRRSNRILLESIPSAYQLIFPVHRPADCFVLLESFMHRLTSSSSPVIFPLGPKIFSLCALLVACLYPDIAVWRISSGPEGEAVDRFPSGLVCGLRAEFPASKSTIDIKHQLSYGKSQRALF
jgi:hypothetical protein